MRISDWISDVCSSDLENVPVDAPRGTEGVPQHAREGRTDARAGGQPGAVQRVPCRRAGVGGAVVAARRCAVLPRLRGGGRAVRHGNCGPPRSEEHTSELQSLMRNSYAVFCLKK